MDDLPRTYDAIVFGTGMVNKKLVPCTLSVISNL